MPYFQDDVRPGVLNPSASSEGIFGNVAILHNTTFIKPVVLLKGQCGIPLNLKTLNHSGRRQLVLRFNDN